MRSNAFGDLYAQSQQDVFDILSARDKDASEVYCSGINEDGEDGGWTAEISTNEDGDTVGYVEATTEAEIVTWLQTAGIELD